MRSLLLPVFTVALASCGLNDDIQAHLSDDPKVCVNGIQYLPYTNGKVQAYTSEGQVITCQSQPAPAK
jgi:hypothetical protein